MSTATSKIEALVEGRYPLEEQINAIARLFTRDMDGYTRAEIITALGRDGWVCPQERKSAQ